MNSIKSSAIIENLIRARLDAAYKEARFQPPYPSFPFRPEAIESAVGLLPRQILMRCQEHRQRCLAAHEVLECTSLAEVGGKEPMPPPPATLDHEFRQQIDRADISKLLEPGNEDTIACDLLIQTCELFLRHFAWPNAIEAVVKPDPDRRKPSLHARLSFTFHDEGDREQHYCFRILGHPNAIAFQSRLKAAMTASGIDTALKFRHLFVLRRGEPPSGTRTKMLVEQFMKAGGKFIAPTDNDLRTFVALRAMAARELAGFNSWLRERQPLFAARLFQDAGLCPPPFMTPKPSGPSNEAGSPSLGREPAPTQGQPAPAQAPPDAVSVKPRPALRERAASERIIPIGRRYAHGVLGDPVTLKASLLSNHLAILAGSGSGKTVLLRRVVEEAALLGIPSIVLDPNNDLARLGDPWPRRPETWSDEDVAKADSYHARADVVIWTPGVSSGNPISLNLLPDFKAIGNKQDKETEDERAQAVEMARATLEPYIGGSGQKAQLKQGVLADALRVFAKSGGCGLDALIQLLSELPDDVSKIGNAPKLAAEIANQMLAAIATNPLLQSQGQSLDPKTLFEGASGKTRVSVVNLAGLASEEARNPSSIACRCPCSPGSSAIRAQRVASTCSTKRRISRPRARGRRARRARCRWSRRRGSTVSD